MTNTGNSSMATLEDLKQELLETESRSLDETVTELSPLYFEDGDPVETIRTSILENEIIVVKGAPGTGKTSAIYEALTRLSEDSSEVIIPETTDPNQFDSELLPSLEEGDSESKQIIFGSYNTNQVGKIGIPQLYSLFSLVETNFDGTLVIECRTELWESLRTAIDQYNPEILDHASLINFDSDAVTASPEDIVQYVIETCDREPTETNSDSLATELQEYNPRHIKVATRVRTDSSVQADNLRQAEKALREDIRPIFSETATFSQEHRTLLIYLAMFGELDISTLGEGLKVTETQVRDLIADLDAFIQITGASASMSSEVYANVIRRYCIENETGLDKTINAVTVAKQFRENIHEVARNLANVYTIACEQSEHSISEKSIQFANHFLRDASTVVDSEHSERSWLVGFDILARNSVPVALDIIEDNLPMIIERHFWSLKKSEIENRTDEDHIEEIELTGNNIAQVLAAHVGREYEKSPDDLRGPMKSILKEVINSKEFDNPAYSGPSEKEFVLNIFAIAVDIQIRRPHMEVTTANIQFIEDCVLEAAKDVQLETSDALLLRELYNKVVRSLVRLQPRNEAEFDNWLESVDEHVSRIATSDQIEYSFADFVHDVYIHGIVEILDTVSSTTTTDAYIETVKGHVRSVIDESDHPTATEETYNDIVEDFEETIEDLSDDEQAGDDDLSSLF